MIIFNQVLRITVVLFLNPVKWNTLLPRTDHTIATHTKPHTLQESRQVGHFVHVDTHTHAEFSSVVNKK